MLARLQAGERQSEDEHQEADQKVQGVEAGERIEDRRVRALRRLQLDQPLAVLAELDGDEDEPQGHGGGDERPALRAGSFLQPLLAEVQDDAAQEKDPEHDHRLHQLGRMLWPLGMAVADVEVAEEEADEEERLAGDEEPHPQRAAVVVDGQRMRAHGLGAHAASSTLRRSSCVSGSSVVSGSLGHIQIAATTTATPARTPAASKDCSSTAVRAPPRARAINSGVTVSFSPSDTDSGSASNAVVESVWRPSSRTREPAGSWNSSCSSQSGCRVATVGRWVKACALGGEVVDHSSESAFHGFFPAIRPRR